MGNSRSFQWKGQILPWAVAQLTFVLSSHRQQMSTWSDLPLDILLEVYCLLPCQDKFNMSLTCKHWHLPLLNAKIWRYTHFKITSHNCKLRIPESVLLALRRLTVDCSVTVGLTVVSQNCADKIEQLLQLPEILSRLKKLTELSISCGFLSADMLSNLPGTLKLMKLLSRDGYLSNVDPATLPEAWATLATKVPTLKVEYHFLDMEQDWSQRRMLPQEVPLTSVHWKSSKSPRGAKKNRLRRLILSCIQYIMNTFQSLLELHITVGIDMFDEGTIANIAERFRQLETLTICQKRSTRRFNLQRLEQSLRYMLDRDLLRGLIKTNITVKNVFKSRTEVFTIRDWVCVLDIETH